MLGTVSIQQMIKKIYHKLDENKEFRSILKCLFSIFQVMELDDVDKRILKNLMVDARLSARQLAIKLGLSTVTVLSRIKKLEKEKIVKGYTAMIDQEKLGYDLTAVIEIIAKKEKIIDIEKKLSSFENVCAVYDITGTSDTLIIGKFKNRDELSKFVKGLSGIPNIENTITHIVLNTVKEDFRLT